MAEYTSKYSDAQKIKFAADEACVKTIHGRKVEEWAKAIDVAFHNHGKNYIAFCNKFKGGNIQVMN